MTWGATMHAHEFAAAVAALLSQTNGVWTEPTVRKGTKECRDEIYQDSIAHGQSIEDPFFNLMILDDWAIFTFFDASFSVYLLSCEPYRLISQTEEFAMVDTAECKNVLAVSYGKTHPDLVVARGVAEQWLEFS